MYEGECKSVRVMAQKIAADLQRRFPDAEAELYVGSLVDAKPTATFGTIQSVLARFCEMTKDYAEAWVRYHPEHPEGVVVKMVGHCGRRTGACDWECRHYQERSRAVIALRPADVRSGADVRQITRP